MDDIRVVALSSTNPQNTLTWRLRVEVLLPHLRAQGITVDTLWVPKDRRQAMRFFGALPAYDIIWLHRHLLWPSELRRLCPVAPHLVLDIDDPVDRSSSKLGNFSLPRCLKFRATAGRCSAILAASNGLVNVARSHNPRVFFVPLCADPARYTMRTRSRLPDEPLRLLWLGGKSTFKYLEQKREHLETVGQSCSKVELIVVAHSQLHLANLPVQNIPWSPATELEQLARCHVGLVPMAYDRWTRNKAALKPLQYLANGMPFIGSPVGVNRRLADHGRNGLLADTPEDWARAVQHLEAAEPQRSQMGQHGVAYIRRYHSPGVLAAQVAQVFRDLGGQQRLARAS